MRESEPQGGGMTSDELAAANDAGEGRTHVDEQGTLAGPEETAARIREGVGTPNDRAGQDNQIRRD